MINRRLYTLRAMAGRMPRGRGDSFISIPQPGTGGQIFDWGSLFRVGVTALGNYLSPQAQLPAPIPTPQLPVPGTGMPQIGFPIPGVQLPQLPGTSVKVPKVGRATKVIHGQLVFGVPRSRRLNPCNQKALGRAGRRIKAFTKMYKRIEKSLPKRHTTIRTGGKRKCS